MKPSKSRGFPHAAGNCIVGTFRSEGARIADTTVTKPKTKVKTKVKKFRRVHGKRKPYFVTVTKTVQYIQCAPRGSTTQLGGDFTYADGTSTTGATATAKC